nr:uncharacterized protein LOC128688799 [Cherax quadricarinatus]
MDVNDRPSCQEADDPKKKVAGSQEAKEVPEGKHIPRILRWEGPVPFPAIPDTNYASYMLSVLAQYGNQVALVDAATGEHRTYLEVSRVVPRIRAGLEDAGVLPEEAILLITPNHIEFALVLLAVVLQGAACVPISPDLSPEEVGNIIRVSEAKWAVVHEAGLDKFGAALALLPSRTVKEVWVLSDDPAQHSLPTLMTDELTHKPVQERSFDPRSTAAVILFSSGTTGVPKGVMLSHTNLLAAVLQSKEVRAAGKHGDVNKLESVLLMLPVYHSFGFSLLMSCLFSGGKVVIVRKFVPEQFLHYIHKYQLKFQSAHGKSSLLQIFNKNS